MSYRQAPGAVEIVLKLGVSLVLSLGISFLAAQWLVPMLDPQHAAKEKAKKSKKELMRRLGRPDLKTNEHEDLIAQEAINPQNIDVSFDDIGGLEEEKRRLKEIVILPFTRPELFARGKLLRPPKGVLLYGPPGTGKTMLVKAIAKETQAVFINLSLSTLQDKWFGESQKLCKAVFTLAWSLSPSIIFIDEIDAFLSERKDHEQEASQSMKAEFMAMWDGLATDDDAHVIVIGATNRPWAIDKAILRRMPRSFLIDVPGVSERRDILERLLKHEVVNADIDLEELALQTEGYSGSDLKELCRAALLAPVQDFMSDEIRGKKNIVLRPLAMRDIMGARVLVPPTAQCADDYLRKSTGMTKDDFMRMISGQ
mmetsp:Transcript_13923/g.27503  ORF Transcript_13923/g.27503 Transcript_13923/m.27503 type:complete len:369 (-) Transcript_13923:537-1643(-)|eukprot:CAMPEP_0173378760 /NCGR_PEP_ID=MMETSP1356-20130122/1887_1 /TAXON_ID=77927 ORGANISM="Hemiselmis virescens, Strain PCC157" /NCGR_SAMPLE_ID=MMETSP1356 /ASSEMBLY_ACC=CAM_ASM_000847 /LENGTH=368 /DNA_ID=CAMNT_0014331943 /DNA_START=62 /DNA_END=1168 /DNA_ORIENTATION=-